MIYDIDAKKRLFAELLLKRPHDLKNICIKVFPNDMRRQMTAYYEWANDCEIDELQANLKEEYGEEHFLPTKPEIVHSIEGVIDTAINASDAIAGYKLIADMLGYITKQPAVEVNTLVDNRNVMVIKDHGDNDAWEKKLAQQQDLLLENASR